MAWGLLRLGRFEEAALHYRDLAAEVPADVDALRGLAESLIGLKRYAEAISLLQVAAEREPANPDVQHLLGQAYTGRGELQDALAAYRRVRTLDPNDAHALTNIAATLFRLGHWEEVVSRSEEALAIQPHPATVHNLGLALMELGRWDEAADAFQKLVRLQPDSSDAQSYLALALTESGHHDAAIRLLDEVTRGRTTNGLALTALAHALRRAGRLPEAREAARTAVAEAPSLPEAHRAGGWASFDAGSAEDALESFQEALRLAPADLDAELGQAVALSALEKHQAAVESFDRALAKSPDWPDDYPELRRYLETSTRATVKRRDAEIS